MISVFVSLSWGPSLATNIKLSVYIYICVCACYDHMSFSFTPLWMLNTTHVQIQQWHVPLGQYLWALCVWYICWKWKVSLVLNDHKPARTGGIAEIKRAPASVYKLQHKFKVHPFAEVYKNLWPIGNTASTCLLLSCNSHSSWG